MDVLSFDKNKVQFDKPKKLVLKLSSNLEVRQLIAAQEYLTVSPMTLDCGIKIKVASISDWDNKILSLKFCQGINLEHALRFGKNETFWSSIIEQVIKKFRQRGFFWGDFAPRNMVFNSTEKTIYIFDFERLLIISDQTPSVDIFSNYFRRYAYEELACFLTRNTQNKIISPVLSKNIEGNILVGEIASQRKILLLKQYFGQKKYYPINEINMVEDLMSSTVTPFKANGKLIYPMHLIEKITEKGGRHEYANIVKQFAGSQGGQEKIKILKSFSEKNFSNGESSDKK